MHQAFSSILLFFETVSAISLPSWLVFMFTSYTSLLWNNLLPCRFAGDQWLLACKWQIRNCDLSTWNYWHKIMQAIIQYKCISETSCLTYPTVQCPYTAKLHDKPPRRREVKWLPPVDCISLTLMLIFMFHWDPKMWALTRRFESFLPIHTTLPCTGRQTIQSNTILNNMQ